MAAPMVEIINTAQAVVAFVLKLQIGMQVVLGVLFQVFGLCRMWYRLR